MRETKAIVKYYGGIALAINNGQSDLPGVYIPTNTPKENIRPLIENGFKQKLGIPVRFGYFLESENGRDYAMCFTEHYPPKGFVHPHEISDKCSETTRASWSKEVRGILSSDLP